jgi:hypothetical protein
LLLAIDGHVACPVVCDLALVVVVVGLVVGADWMVVDVRLDVGTDRTDVDADPICGQLLLRLRLVPPTMLPFSCIVAVQNDLVVVSLVPALVMGELVPVMVVGALVVVSSLLPYILFHDNRCGF